MLKLKRVQILGFKSFCDRTDVQLTGSGIAAIVGPNGCGKSNISDAITWVLGEQSAKSLRGAKMEDVIFAGTRDRKPTGMAEVSLTLVDPDVYDAADGGEAVSIASADRRPAELQDWDEATERSQREMATTEATADAQPGPVQSDEDTESITPDAIGSDAAALEGDPVVLKVRRRKFNRAPVRAGEVTVTRRLFRSGESEYLLNGRLCRLRDIQDIFFGTGLSGENYAIIGQERIGQLLSSKPLDRRAIIEEAAGVTRFKTKKRLAELRLEASRQNLSRIDDIFEEVSKQIVSLKRQAAKADRYRQLQEEFRTKLRIVLRSRLLEKTHDLKSADTSVVELTRLVDERSKHAALLDTEHTATVANGYQVEEELRHLQKEASETQLELERTAARIASNADRIADLDRRKGTLQEEATQLAHQLGAHTADHEKLRDLVEHAHGAAEEARHLTQARQNEANEVQVKVQAADSEAAQGRHQSLQLTHRISQLHREEAQAAESLANLRREAERLTRESEQARRELDELGRQRGQVSLSFESVTERLQRLGAEHSKFQLDLESGRREEGELRQRGDRLRAELATVSGKKQSLDAQIRDHSYSNETVRKLLRAGSSDTAALGTLADFLEVDNNFDALVDEVLRDELNFIVVKDWSAARTGIQLLGTSVDGRATFLVRDGEQVTAAKYDVSRPDSIELNGAIALQAHVRALPGLGVPLGQLISKVQKIFVVPDAAAARPLAVAYPSLFIVTHAGEVFHGHAVTGGKTRSGGPLALKHEAREAAEKLEDLQAQLSACEIAAAGLTQRVREVQDAMETCRDERVKAERDAANSGAALRQMESEAARMERRLAEWVLQNERNRNAVAAKYTTVEQKQADAARLTAEREALDARVQAAVHSVEGLRQQREEAQRAAAEAAATLSGLEERRRNATANFQQNERLQKAAEQRVLHVQAQLTEAAKECQQREEDNATSAGNAETLAATHARLLTDVASRLSSVAALRAVATEQNTTLRTLRLEIEEVRERRSGLQASSARLSAEIEHLQAQTLNDLNTPAVELQADETIATISSEQLDETEAGTRALRSRMDSMGPVNMMALEEFQEASQRHDFLQTQRQDLLDSIANTQGAIREIDEITRQKFDEAFAIINRNFSETFAKLFGGGQAMMKLTDETDTIESGIDLIASPPGKKLQNVLLLSGGEKALTALSLLVGIFEHQPSPFCILDEVDAPLDETNVGRFAHLIHVMSRNTQFVVITHHKRTMSEADLIYGITMQEPGVSKIVSVNLSRNERRAVA